MFMHFLYTTQVREKKEAKAPFSMRFIRERFHLEFLPGNIDLGAMVYDVVDMQQQGEIIRRSQPALDELAHGPGGTRGNHDGFQRNAAELCHGIVKGYTAAQQRADLAGAPRQRW
mgnify:CR=1 FL=1